MLRLAVVALLVAGATVSALGSTPAAEALAGDIGHEDLAYVEAANPTASRAESKVWFNDGTWWAVMEKAGTPTSTGKPQDDFAIYRLDPTTETWIATSTIVDARGTSKADVLWDGTNLFVASHKFVSTATGVPEAAGSNNEAKIFKYTYSSATKTYSAVGGFPKVMNPFRMESLTIDKDSTGVLWAAWVQASNVVYQSSADGGATWTTTTALADPRASTSADDIASVVAFGGNKVGIMWADQKAGNDGFWFSVHTAGTPATSWSAAEPASTGVSSGDDHINVKAAPNGHVYAVVKTRTDTKSNPLVVLLDRGTDGAWHRTTAWIGKTNVTRPIIQVDTARNLLELFVTGPEAPQTKGESGGTIFRKTTPLATPSFVTDGVGEAVMQRPGSSRINDASGTKQPLTATSGAVVIAADPTTKHYWHFHEAGQPVAPSAPGGVSAKAGRGKVTLTWTAATPGTLAITGYRVTATPALPGSGFVDFPANSPGTPHEVAAANNVQRVFHVAAVAGTAGPATDSAPVTPGGYVPFLSTGTFADQQAKDFLGQVAATQAQKDAVRTRFVTNDEPASKVIEELFLSSPTQAGANDGQAARVARLYFAYFLRPPDRTGMDHWINVYRSGRSLQYISRFFAASSEFKTKYGSLTNSGFVDLVYRNLFNRVPDPNGKAFWLRRLDAGFPRGSFMTSQSESNEYRTKSKTRVYVSLVYRAMLGTPPTRAELEGELAKADPVVDHTIEDILLTNRYLARIGTL